MCPLHVVLTEGDCANPEDLSCLADSVYARRNQQRELVERLSPARFEKARPNHGYLLAAAMLRERAISCLMTLNFDLALTAALVQVSASDDVSIVGGPEDQHQLGITNLIYLHRNANADPERWVLRTVTLEFVFPSENFKTPLSPDNVWRRSMKPKLEKIELGWATFQVLRKTNASLSKKAGVDPKVASDQRGHGIGVSLDVYTSSDLEQKRDALKKLEAAVIQKAATETIGAGLSRLME
jgi:hypothetical protein